MRAEDCRLLPIHDDVIVVTHQDLAGGVVEEDVAEANVAIAEPEGVEFVKAPGEMEGHSILRPLALMLDGHWEGERRDDLLAAFGDTCPAVFKRAVELRAVESPSGDRLAACARSTRPSFFGFRRRDFQYGFFLRVGPFPDFIGRVVGGVRRRGEWDQVGESVDVCRPRGRRLVARDA